MIVTFKYITISVVFIAAFSLMPTISNAKMVAPDNPGKLQTRMPPPDNPETPIPDDPGRMPAPDDPETPVPGPDKIPSPMPTPDDT